MEKILWLANSEKTYSNNWSVVPVNFKDYKAGDKIKLTSYDVDVIKKIVYEKDKAFLYTVKGLKISI